MLQVNFEEITNALSEPHFLLTQEGSIISTNRAAKKTFSLNHCNDEILNINSLINIDPEKLKQVLMMWTRSQSPLPASIEFNHTEGSSIRYQCKGNTVRPAKNGEPALIMMHCTDKRQSTSVFITLNENIENLKREIRVRISAEKEIQRLNEDLEQRVLKRTRELENANKKIKRSFDELKNTQEHLIRSERLVSLGSMVAGVAHEINTPIGVCVTAASYLRDQANEYNRRYEEGSLTREDFESFLSTSSDSFAIIISNLERAAELVRSFKQLAVDQTSEEPRVINIKDYLEDLLISLKPYFRHNSHRIELICPSGISIESQPGPIAQIINNLINNSIIHGFEEIKEGIIKIKVTQENDNLLVHYSDNGNGIPEENMSRIFDPFFTTKRNEGGSGLGMNIVYNLVTTKLGGIISAKSEESKGVNFYISIPVHR